MKTKAKSKSAKSTTIGDIKTGRRKPDKSTKTAKKAAAPRLSGATIVRRMVEGKPNMSGCKAQFLALIPKNGIQMGKLNAAAEKAELRVERFPDWMAYLIRKNWVATKA